MSREKTSKIKKEVMETIVKIVPNTKIENRKSMKSGNTLIKAWASKDYGEHDEIHNWYGLFSEELDNNPEDTVFLFTTGDIRNFLIIPQSVFFKNIKPFIRPTSEGFFFLFDRKDGRCYLPKDYVPKDLRAEISDSGIDLSKYVNNLTTLGGSYEGYLKALDIKKPAINPPNSDIVAMIQSIADKDPTFLAKSTEEKLIIIRYHQIEG